MRKGDKEVEGRKGAELVSRKGRYGGRSNIGRKGAGLEGRSEQEGRYGGRSNRGRKSFDWEEEVSRKGDMGAA